MLDLETLGTAPGCVVVAVGAVMFDPQGTEAVRVPDLLNPQADEFYKIVEIQSCLDIGLKINASTLYWWMQQSTPARQEISSSSRHHIHEVIDGLAAWYRKSEALFVWSNGASFDVPIMDYVYNHYHEQPPWNFQNVRDTRTMWAMMQQTRTDLSTYGFKPHIAVHDAAAQAISIQQCYSKLIEMRNK